MPNCCQAPEQPYELPEVVEVSDLGPEPELPELPLLLDPIRIVGPRYEVPKKIRNSLRSGVSHVKINVGLLKFLLEVNVNASEGYTKEFSRHETTRIKTEWWRFGESGVVEEEAYWGPNYYSWLEEAVAAMDVLLKAIGTGEVKKLEVVLEFYIPAFYSDSDSDNVSDFDYDADFEGEKKEFLERLVHLLQTRKYGRRLNVHELILEYDGEEEQEALSFIANLKFVGKKAILFRRFFTDDDITTPEMGKVVQLETWKGLTELTIEDSFCTEMGIEHWKHFTNVSMMRDTLEEDLLREIVAIASKTPDYSCIIRVQDSRGSLAVLQFVATLDARSPTSFRDPSTGIQIDIADKVYTFTGPRFKAYLLPLVRIVLHPGHSSFRRTDRDRKSLEELCTVKTFPGEPERVGCKAKRRVLMMDTETERSLTLPTFEMFAYHIDQCSSQLRHLGRFEDMHEIENLEVSVAHAPDDQRYSEAVLKFLEKAKEVLKNRERRLKVHKFIMEYSEQGHVLEVLPYLEMVGARELHLRKAGDCREEQVMDEIVKLRQWRLARKITMFGGWTRWSDDWAHLEKSRIVVERLDVDVVEKILQVAQKSETFVSCTIGTMEDLQNPEVVEHMKSSFQKKSSMEFKNEAMGIEVILSENLFIFKKNY